MKDDSLNLAYNIPYGLTREIRTAAELFDKIEVWRKRDVTKDPIAIGVLEGERISSPGGGWKSCCRLKLSRNPFRLF